MTSRSAGRVDAGAPRPLAPPPVLRWEALDATGVIDAAVTTRHGGVSTGDYASLNLGLHVGDDPAAVVENRWRATAAIGCTPHELVVAAQCHGGDAAVIGPNDAGRGAVAVADAIPDVDALVTASGAVALAVLVADCVPIVLVDPKARILGCIHAGWRGTAAGVTGAAVAAMVRLGAAPPRLMAGIGPAVDPTTYEVGDDVADALHTVLGDERNGVLSPAGPQRWRCDLPAANVRLLTAAGVHPANIHRMSPTTADPRFYSHRRGDTGRFAVLARLTTAENQ